MNSFLVGGDLIYKLLLRVFTRCSKAACNHFCELNALPNLSSIDKAISNFWAEHASCLHTFTV